MHPWLHKSGTNLILQGSVCGIHANTNPRKLYPLPSQSFQSYCLQDTFHIFNMNKSFIFSFVLFFKSLPILERIVLSSIHESIQFFIILKLILFLCLTVELLKEIVCYIICNIDLKEFAVFPNVFRKLVIKWIFLSLSFFKTNMYTLNL